MLTWFAVWVFATTAHARDLLQAVCTGKTDGLYAQGQCTAAYWQCANGYTYPRTCAPGTVFDASTGTCNWSWATPSCSSPISPPPTKPSPTPCSPSPAVPRPSPAPPVKGQSPSQTPTSSPRVPPRSPKRTKSPVLRSPSRTPKPSPPLPLPSPNRMPSPVPRALSPTLTSSPALPPPSPVNPVAPPSPGTGFCSGKADGFYASAACGSSFYQCANGRTYVRPCPAGLVWSQAQKVCDWPSTVSGCGGGPTPMPSPARPSPVVTTPLPSPVVAAVQSPKTTTPSSPPPVLSSSPVPASHHSSTVVLYWGQNSWGWGDANRDHWEKPLRAYCDSAYTDILVIGFMHVFPTASGSACPQLNFAFHCETTFANGMLSCPAIGADISYCQSKGKKVLLSLGGASGAYGFSSDSQAATFANTLWNMVLGGDVSQSPCPYRPFGSAVVDGVDLDIEGGSTAGYAAFVRQLRSNYAKDTSRTYYVAGAPQCPFPDAYLGPSGASALSTVSFDWLFVQFYNNYCAPGSNFNFHIWGEWAVTAPNPSVKIFLGVPASARAAGSGYNSYTALISTISSIQSSPSFGGVMMWDASNSDNNLVNGQSYADAIGAYLRA